LWKIRKRMMKRRIARVSEGHYQYAVFDEDGNKKSINTNSLRRVVETKEVLETFACNKGKKLIVKRRIVMAWEQVEYGEEQEEEA
jgi:hypothetical protein